jgi:protein-tyrosine phosphatase
VTANRPIRGSYWLVDGTLLAGPYPVTYDRSATRESLAAFVDAGIRTFINLTETSEALTDYDSVLQELAAERGLELKHLRHAIQDHGVPAQREQMTRILATLRDELAADRPVYVHCWGGIGRTGTVIGCWLVEEGLAGTAAIERIAELRAGTPDCRVSSPETDDQRRYICEWMDGEA